MSQAEIFSRTEIADGITLFHHRSRKWKTELARVVFVGRLGDRMAARALATQLLRHGTSRTRGLTEVARYLQGLYGATSSAYVNKTPLYHLVNMSGMVVASDFLPRRRDTLGAMWRFMNDSACRPWFARRDFDEATFGLERGNLLKAIDAIADNKPHYADLRLVQEMFGDHPIGVPAYGRRGEVAALTLEDVRDAFRDTVAGEPVALYVVTPRSRRDVVTRLRKHLDLEPRAPRRTPRFRAPPLRGRAHTIVERQAIHQSRLSIGFRIVDYKRSRDQYVGLLGDMVFGGDSTSRLFKNVREKHSLAYSVHSSFDSRTGTLSVAAGIDGRHVDRVRRLVRSQVRQLGGGRVTPEELDIARAAISKSLNSAHDSPMALTNLHLGLMLAGQKETTVEGILRRYARVTPERVAELFSRLRLDTTFFLEQTA